MCHGCPSSGIHTSRAARPYSNLVKTTGMLSEPYQGCLHHTYTRHPRNGPGMSFLLANISLACLRISRHLAQIFWILWMDCRQGWAKVANPHVVELDVAVGTDFLILFGIKTRYCFLSRCHRSYLWHRWLWCQSRPLTDHIWDVDVGKLGREVGLSRRCAPLLGGAGGLSA